MRRTFQAKTFNTKTATEIAIADFRGLSAAHWYVERLYKTEENDHFIVGIGGDLSRWRGEVGLVPLDANQLEYWHQKNKTRKVAEHVNRREEEYEPV